MQASTSDSTTLSSAILCPALFIRVTAAGTGDILFVNTREILALEFRKEPGGNAVVILKDGKAIPVIEEPETLIQRLDGDEACNG